MEETVDLEPPGEEIGIEINIEKQAGDEFISKSVEKDGGQETVSNNILFNTLEKVGDFKTLCICF